MPTPAGYKNETRSLMWTERRKAVLEDLSFLISQGETMPRLAERLGLKPDSLARNIERWRSQGFTDIFLP